MINIQDIISLLRKGYVAMDASGKWWWYDTKPIPVEDFEQWQWVYDRGETCELCMFDIAPADDWTKSLIKVGGK